MSLRINVDKMRHLATLIAAKRKIQEVLWPALNALGEKNVKTLIEQDRPLFSKLRGYKEFNDYALKAPKYRSYMAELTDKDLIGFLPEWFYNICAQSNRGRLWLSKEISYLRSLYEYEEEQHVS